MSKAKGFLNIVEGEDKGNLNQHQNWVADCFARFLIGDSSVALKQLEKLKGTVPTPQGLSKDPEAYNKTFSELYKSFLSTIKKLEK